MLWNVQCAKHIHITGALLHTVPAHLKPDRNLAKIERVHRDTIRRSCLNHQVGVNKRSDKKREVRTCMCTILEPHVVLTLTLRFPDQGHCGLNKASTS